MHMCVYIYPGTSTYIFARDLAPLGERRRTVVQRISHISCVYNRYLKDVWYAAHEVVARSRAVWASAVAHSCHEYQIAYAFIRNVRMT